MTYPANRLVRALFADPPITDIASRNSQFAGRTSLASGSASVTVSTTAISSDSIIKIATQAALAAEFVTQGRASVASGTATQPVSTTAVYSGQVILVSAENATDQASGLARGWRVNSVVDGVSFALTTDDGKGPVGTTNLMWKILGADPGAIKVNTISPGNFVTFGRADGVARPFSEVIMWEVFRGS